MEEEKKKVMQKIFCWRCHRENYFRNGTCDVCGKKVESDYNVGIIIALIIGIIASIIICGIVLNEFEFDSNEFGGFIYYLIYSLILVWGGCLFGIGKFIKGRNELLKISEENTKLMEELELKAYKEMKEQERREKEYQEKIRLQKIKQEKMEMFYKECSENKLFEIESDENKNKILEISEKYEVKEDIELLMQQMYYAESKKDIIFSDYMFLKPIKKIIKEIGIINFIKKCNHKCNFNKSNESIGDYFKKKILQPRGIITKNDISELFECIEYYNKIIDIIENDEELNTICSNLLEIYINKRDIDDNYFSEMVYDIYQNSYKEKYKINITKKDFSNVFDLMKRKKRKKSKKENYSDFYTLILEDYKDAKELPEKIYQELVYHKRNTKFLEDIGYYYILEKKSELSFYEICRLLLDMDGIWAKCNNMVNKEINRIEKQEIIEKAKKKELENKERIERERLRLLKGDISKEVEINNEIHQKKIKQKEIEIGYQNVKDGFEFEEYVSDLYSKLGYATSVTRKSGDQRSRYYCNKKQ